MIWWQTWSNSGGEHCGSRPAAPCFHFPCGFSMSMTLAVCRFGRRGLEAEHVEGFSGVPTFIMGMSMGGALAVQTIRAVVSLLLP